MNSPILSVAGRMLLPLALLFSLYLLWRGHNEPGGGFVGGLVAAAGFTVHALPRERRVPASTAAAASAASASPKPTMPAATMPRTAQAASNSKAGNKAYSDSAPCSDGQASAPRAKSARPTAPPTTTSVAPR